MAFHESEAEKAMKIDQKLHLQGMVKALEYGKLPNNSQIVQHLRYLQNIDFRPKNYQISESSREFIIEFKQLLQDLSDFVERKNHGELLQNLLWFTSTSDEGLSGLSASERADLREDGRKLRESLKTVSWLLISKYKFRVLCLRLLESLNETFSGNNNFNETEQSHEAFNQFKQLMIEAQSNQDYVSAIHSIISLVREYMSYISVTATDRLGDLRQNGRLSKAGKELEKFLEHLSGERSLSELKSTISSLHQMAENDQKLRHWFQDLDLFLQKSLNDSEYIRQDYFRQDFHSISQRGRNVVEKNYGDLLRKTRNEVKYLFDGIKDDPLNTKLARSISRLVKLMEDSSNGSDKVRENLAKDFIHSFLPRILDEIKYIPISRVEVIDPRYDFVLENIVLNADDLIPNDFEMRFDSILRYHRKPNIDMPNRHFIFLHLGGMKLNLQNISYYLRRKNRMSKVVDMGVADFIVGGKGMSLDLTLSKLPETLQKTNKRYFRVMSLNVRIGHLRITLHETQHRKYYRLFSRSMTKMMRLALCKSAEEQIRSIIEQCDRQVYSVNEAVERRYNTAMRHSDGMAQISRADLYMDEIEKRLLEAKEQRPGRVPQVNVTEYAEKGDLSDIQLPSPLADAYRRTDRLIARGNDWHSPIFDVGTITDTARYGMPKRSMEGWTQKIIARRDQNAEAYDDRRELNSQRAATITMPSTEELHRASSYERIERRSVNGSFFRRQSISNRKESLEE